MGPIIREFKALGFQCSENVDLGHLCVEHDGAITWDQLQAIKCIAWGRDAVAIEVYPPDAHVVNTRCMRHLWRLGVGEFYPDLIGQTSDVRAAWRDTLEARFVAAWEDAERVFQAEGDNGQPE
ncbi:MAG: hypothetical protein AAGP08_00130 [Pseudomonadota bacterium]